MPKPPILPRLPPSPLCHHTLRLAVARRDAAVARGRSPDEVRREVASTVLAAHIALPQPMIEEAIALVMGWRAVRLAPPPAELPTVEAPRSALAGLLASRGIVVGVLGGPAVAALPALAVAAE